jgi:hypothetical protein
MTKSGEKPTAERVAADILADATASHWLKIALLSALDRDPLAKLDALTDAIALTKALKFRLQNLQLCLFLRDEVDDGSCALRDQ